MQKIQHTFDSIHHGDCRNIIKSFPKNSIDLIFADPPYNLQLTQDLWRHNYTKVESVNDEWDRFSSFKEYDEFTHQWLTECQRVLKDTGTIWVIGTYHNIYRVGAIMQDLGFWILNDVVWIKNNPMPNFRGVRFTNAHETLIWAQKKRGAKYTFNHHAMKALNNDLQMRSDWNLPLATGRERVKSDGAKAHSTQKPEALLYRVLLSSTNPGDVVLDPFFGSGTTGAVAKRLGRHFVGIERDAKYIRVAQKRIDAVMVADEESLNVSPSKPQRVPFGNLIESGLLEVGQTLHFAKNGLKAKVLANGHIKCEGEVGSIHAIASSLTGAPANGWDLWLYEDESGNKRPINELRARVRGNLEALPLSLSGRGTG